MQEEVTQKTMALAITTSRMTASVLAKAMRKFLEAQKNKSHQLPKGKQTLKELMKHNTGVSNLEITDHKHFLPKHFKDIFVLKILVIGGGLCQLVRR